MSHPPTPGNMRTDGPMDMDAIGTGNSFSTPQNASCMNVSHPDAHEGPSTVKLSKIIACEIKVMCTNTLLRNCRYAQMPELQMSTCVKKQPPERKNKCRAQ